MSIEVNLEAIHPSRGEKFSPNLHQYLKRLRPNILPFQQVYHAADGTLYLGWMDDHYLNGCKLISALCNGGKTETWAFPIAHELTLIPDFWDRYTAIGRCAIDEDHKMYFIGDNNRWKEVGEERCCTWCNDAKQRKVVETEVVKKECWVSHP